MLILLIWTGSNKRSAGHAKHKNKSKHKDIQSGVDDKEVDVPILEQPTYDPTPPFSLTDESETSFSLSMHPSKSEQRDKTFTRVNEQNIAGTSWSSADLPQPSHPNQKRKNLEDTQIDTEQNVKKKHKAQIPEKVANKSGEPQQAGNLSYLLPLLWPPKKLIS